MKRGKAAQSSTLRAVVLFLSALLTAIVAIAATPCDIRKVRGEATYIAPESVSLAEARHNAATRARVAALEKEYGTSLTQNQSTVLTGDSAVFLSLSSSRVRGEWIEDLAEPQYDVSIHDGQIVVTATVCGHVRGLENTPVPLTAYALRSGTEERCASREFCDGDDVYLYFSSPVDGYMAAFLTGDFSEPVYCLLPYRGADGRAVKVKKDEKYIFFSPKHSDRPELVDEYSMSADGRDVVMNDIYILFSPREFSKPPLAASSDLSLISFMQWMGVQRTQDPSMQLSVITLKTTKQ